MQILNPIEIENQSFKIIQSKINSLGGYAGESQNLDIIKRVIHATADFDFLENLYFSRNAINNIREIIKSQEITIITDTEMLKSGINKRTCEKFGVKIICYSSDYEIKIEAQNRNVTRAIVNIEHAVKNFPNAIYAIGNAPTALIRLCELVNDNKANPALIIGVPVGFVNVIEAKKFLETLDIPKIISFGNKGGSTVACAIVNAILYGL